MSDAEDATAPAPEAEAGGSGWMEPPWTGFIETTGDALLILEAARQGIIPRVTRRLVEAERKMIGSGAVFVFDEEESGIKRWTDGFFWSPSRILGNFLLYRETEKKPTNRGRAKRVEAAPSQSPMSAAPVEHSDEPRHLRALVGSLTDTQKFKSEGLMKKTFSLSIGGVAQHLISYYRPSDVESGRLTTPSTHEELSKLEISPEYLDKTHFRVPPRTEVGADGIVRYVGESEELDLTKPAPPPRAPSARRFNPLDQAKRPRRVKKEEPAEPFPASYFMPPPYQSYQPYFVGGDPAAAAAAGAYYAPYQIAPYGAGYGAPPPPDDDDDDDGDKDADADADADGEDDLDA